MKSEDLMDRGVRAEVRGGLTVDIQKKLNQSTVPEYAEFHGQTGATMGGAGYSPLFRTVHFAPLQGKGMKLRPVGGSIEAVAGQGR